MIPVIAAANAIDLVGKISDAATSLFKHAAPAGAGAGGSAPAHQGPASSFAAHLAAAAGQGG